MVARAAAGAVLVLAAIASGTGCTSSSQGGAPSTAEVTALLDRHGSAVLHHAQQDFLHDVDTSRPAAAFRDRQSAQFAALAAVPLQSWSYAVQAPVTDASAVAAATARYGAPTAVMHLTLSYALQGIDKVPSRHDLWWSFVRRHGRVVVAGDDDLAQLGGAGWRGPWDFGPLVAQRGLHSLVLGHPQDAVTLPELAQAVDSAVPAVTGVWGDEWAQQVAVVVPASAEELDALTGQSGTLTDVSAETVSDPRDPVTGAVPGQRVIMNPRTLGSLTEVGRRIVVRHEVTHVAAAAATAEGTPRWLVEGFAEYVGNLGSGQPVSVAAAELRADVRRGRVPGGLPADDAFAPGSPGLAQVYEQSWLACRLIAARAGQAGLVRLYRLVGASTQPADAAVASAMQSVQHESIAEFTERWLAYLRTELA